MGDLERRPEPRDHAGHDVGGDDAAQYQRQRRRRWRGGGGGNAKHSKVAWNTVTVDVLNGFGGSGAAASNAAVLRAAGWTVGTTGNASGITKTEVVYLPGHQSQAKAVSKKLGLGQPVPIAQATGVPTDATTGVAVVLGSDQLTNTTVQ